MWCTQWESHGIALRFCKLARTYATVTLKLAPLTVVEGLDLSIYLVLRVAILTFSYALVERRQKEDWVLRETYRLSYFSLLETMNANPAPVILVNPRG